PEHVTFSGYTDSEKDALYPFGFGLSYTTFEYGEPKISASQMNAGEELELSFTLRNTGKVKGREVVQLYLRDVIASATRPMKELKNFQLVELAPGESKSIKFIIDDKMLQFYSANRIWESEAGDFELFIGGNSKDLKKVTFSLNK